MTFRDNLTVPCYKNPKKDSGILYASIWCQRLSGNVGKITTTGCVITLKSADFICFPEEALNEVRYFCGALLSRNM